MTRLGGTRRRGHRGDGQVATGDSVRDHDSTPSLPAPGEPRLQPIRLARPLDDAKGPGCRSRWIGVSRRFGPLLARALIGGTFIVLAGSAVVAGIIDFTRPAADPSHPAGGGAFTPLVSV